ncbi:alpha-1,6-mannosyltransferas-like protein subunit [Lindgomyces ingoldianus]|uniref:Alpha-1,6-mannosyltransferas-like protein subunit n=1 Tax=Lindgomyces ingoldianus TaxID=673940 RepID=A0ACB6QUD1_9PLEO|nr:alpha-1,6-mannosyltransferas-like protein subunit [Lindgomyces ingoldianus]KAF2470629.1 alpha-1,6-mannosyltransferas-like protein subunit [Lindgomyces ingoldianus]
MPPRKTSRPPPYAARNSKSIPVPPALRNLLVRDKLRLMVVCVLGFLTILWLWGRMGGGGGVESAGIIGSGAPVVIVTVIDPKTNPAWIEKIKKNREDYAKRHGYATFFPDNTDYPLRNSPVSWAKVPAMRHAMTLHPTSSFFWYLDSTALIMNPSIPLQSHVLTPTRLEKLMMVNEPIVPPDSVIKTFGNLKGDRIDVVITQDKDGLSQSSFIVRRGEWAKYFLDAWFDPIYRSYNFQKAEAHALEHIVQWHGTILAKLALIPQNTINAYVQGPANHKNGQYKEGDLVATFPGCDKDKRSCADEMQPFFDILGGKDNGRQN